MVFRDQLNREVILAKAPKRIVSLVPSQTELLYSLGLDTEVVGITKFCVHPSSWFGTKQRVGGTKQVHIDVVKQLNPDLIIANKEENLQEDIDQLMDVCPVWVSNIQTLPEALAMICSIGEITGKPETAGKLVEDIRQEFSKIRKPAAPLTAAYFIWREPWMAAGGDTFINEMLEHCGIINIYKNVTRYPEVSLEELAKTGCHYVLLSSEPYPFKEKHIAEIQQFLPDASIKLVDGEMFSWYGSRLLEAPAYFNGLQL